MRLIDEYIRYLKWVFKMRMYLIKEDVWQVVDPNAAAPAPGQAEEEDAQNARRQEKALVLISLLVDNGQVVLLRGVEAAKHGRKSDQIVEEVVRNGTSTGRFHGVARPEARRV